MSLSSVGRSKSTESSAKQPVNNTKPEPIADIQAVVHTQADLMSMFPDCFIGLGKVKGEPYHIVMDPHVAPKKTPCRSLPNH